MTNIDPDLLQDFAPLHELSPASRAQLAGKSKVVDFPVRKQIRNADSGHWLTYLLEGEVALSDGQGERLIVAGGTRARRPLFALTGQQSGYSLQSRSPATRLLLLDRTLFDLLLREQRVDDYEVQDTPLNDTEGLLLYRIYQAIKDGTLSLPSMPEVALRIRDATLRPEASLQDIARIVQLDPVVAAGLMRVANSAALRGTQPIRSLSEALNRLGFEKTRSLATQIAISQVFKAPNALIGQRMHALWEHSVRTSALAAVLARHSQGLDAEHAQLAGLLHDIGCVPLLAYAAGESPFTDGVDLEQALRQLGVPVGLLVLDYWELGGDLTQVVQYADNWERASSQATPETVDLIIVAQRLQLGDDGTLPALDDMPAYRRLGLGAAEPELTDALRQEGERYLAEIRSLLTPQST